jgi:hypothetical protein
MRSASTIDGWRINRYAEPLIGNILHQRQAHLLAVSQWRCLCRSPREGWAAGASATLNHALAALSEALDGRTDTQQVSSPQCHSIVLAHVYGQPDGAIAVSDPADQ